MRTMKSYTARGVNKSNTFEFEMPGSVEILGLAVYPTGLDITFTVIEETPRSSPVKPRKFHRWACSQVPENLDNFRHIWTFRDGTFVTYIFEEVSGG